MQSEPIPEIKKSLLVNDWENIAYYEDPEESEVLANKCVCFPQVQFCEVMGKSQPHEHFSIFTLI